MVAPNYYRRKAVEESLFSLSLLLYVVGQFRQAACMVYATRVMISNEVAVFSGNIGTKTTKEDGVPSRPSI